VRPGLLIDWDEYVVSLYPIARKIGRKYCDCDDTRQDAVQYAMMSLWSQCGPEKVHGYDEYLRGRTDPEAWRKRLGAYCRQVLSFRTQTYLAGWTTGRYEMGRTIAGVYHPPRVQSLDFLRDEGVDFDTYGQRFAPKSRKYQEDH
jgi:hypothetical protein